MTTTFSNLWNNTQILDDIKIRDIRNSLLSFSLTIYTEGDCESKKVQFKSLDLSFKNSIPFGFEEIPTPFDKRLCVLDQKVSYNPDFSYYLDYIGNQSGILKSEEEQQLTFPLIYILSGLLKTDIVNIDIPHDLYSADGAKKPEDIYFT